MPVPQPTRSAGGLTVWVTRARPGAEATAERLRAAGHRPWVMPLLAVEPLAGAALPLAGVGALAFTSANAVRVFSAAQGRRDLPVFAVGDATAQAADRAGFLDVRSADGDVAALARLIADARPVGEVLHPAAERSAGDLAGALRGAGVYVRSVPIYRTVVVAPTPPPVAPDAVLLHSPRAAGALAGVLRRGLAGVASDRLDALGLSPACVAPLTGSGLRSLGAAAHPDEDALLALLA